MNLRFFQKGFNYSQDGPGNRLVYHLQGCNLHCPWCSNPEGMSLDGGEERSVESVVEEAVSCRAMFFDGGGVTLTGGEVTMQLTAVRELLALLREEKIHNCIETNGVHPKLPTLFRFLDYLIMDVKHHNPETHRRVTGISSEKTYENLRDAIRIGLTPALRIPLIGGFNASEADAHAFVKLFDSLDIREHTTIEVLPYHEYGKNKYEKLGIPYQMGEEARISRVEVQAFENILYSAGYKLIHT